MSYITRSRVLSSSLRRTCLQSRSFTVAPARLATQRYGDGEGHPQAEKPQDQGANPSASREHPGPPPPKAGEGSGGGPTKGTPEGHTKTNQTTGSTQQKRQFSTMRRLYAEKKPKTTDGLKPKILDETRPAEHEESDDVKKHNEEFKNRADRAHESIAEEGEKKKHDSSPFLSEKKGDKAGGGK